MVPWPHLIFRPNWDPQGQEKLFSMPGPHLVSGTRMSPGPCFSPLSHLLKDLNPPLVLIEKERVLIIFNGYNSNAFLKTLC